MDESDPLARLQAILGHSFRDPSLLQLALTHASAKTLSDPSNERLEFLGDAVLGMVVGHFLYWAFPDLDEGRLTRMRGGVVSTTALARFADELGLAPMIRIGKGLSSETLPPSVLANVMEAVIGALFLDGGLEAVRPMVLWGLCEPIEDELHQRADRNWKSLLQERTQQFDKITPTYEVVGERGPDHEKEFVVAVLVDGVERGRGTGASKKLAEQAAAQVAFEELGS